jgi:hypothetical protein
MGVLFPCSEVREAVSMNALWAGDLRRNGFASSLRGNLCREVREFVSRSGFGV